MCLTWFCVLTLMHPIVSFIHYIFLKFIRLSIGIFIVINKIHVNYYLMIINNWCWYVILFGSLPHVYPFVLMYGGAVEFLPIVGIFCQISDICMHQLISQLSTNQLVAEASISYSEHVRQTLMFSNNFLHD